MPASPADGPVADATVRQGKIALEEHFMLPEMLKYFFALQRNVRPDLLERAIPVLSDFGEGRLATMDAQGIDYAVLSLSGPGVQIEHDAAIAGRLARRCNDALAEEIARRPDRYGGFAHLALQDPGSAADELERCVRDLGFAGALINGASDGLYLDDRRFDVFWERAADLGVPVYLHAANALDRPAMYDGHPALWGPAWSWTVETATHALRLVFGGTFDRYPAARLVLGHMGETLPFQLTRLDRGPRSSPAPPALKRLPSDYVRDNILVTTSGVFSDAALHCALAALGVDNVMFSVDYPFEDGRAAAEWFAAARIDDDTRGKIASGNAERLLRLRRP